MTSNDSLIEQIRHLERNSRKTSWLLKQLGRKVAHFPRDLKRRLRKSLAKRLGGQPPAPPKLDLGFDHFQFLELPSLPNGVTEVRAPFILGHREEVRLSEAISQNPTLAVELQSMAEFTSSEKMRRLIGKAAADEPEVGELTRHIEMYCPPWHDGFYRAYQALTSLVPAGSYEAIVLMPSCRMGGADRLAATLARALAQKRRVLVLRTDDTPWDRPDWFEGITSVDLSDALSRFDDRERALYILLAQLGAAQVFNVNSRLCFDTFVTYGERLATQMRLYAYYFCADRTESGLEVGYPISYFQNVLPSLTAALFDTRSLADQLIARYHIPSDLAARLITVDTPAQISVAKISVAALRNSETKTEAARPKLLWAGRFDRQKRFDLLLAIAEAMPEVDFHVWGKAVLDAPPQLSVKPENLTIHPPFITYEELPFAEADGWLYTSGWDGLPGILIDIGALGIPVVASDVGGVSELVTNETGWLVPENGSVADYVAALRELIADPEERLARAERLKAAVAQRHTAKGFTAAIDKL